MNNQRTTTSLKISHVKSSTVQDVFQPIPGLISCAEETWPEMGLLSHAQKEARWLAFFRGV